MKRDILKLIMGMVMLFSIWWIMEHFLFGEIRETTAEPVTSETENTYVVVLDPGHGGVDPGMMGVNNTIEKEINLQIAERLETKLLDQGITVLLTRETDDGLYSSTDGNKKISDMKKRCQIITDSKADLVISIHQNSFSDEKVSGAQVFYYKHSKEGELLAQCIQDSLRENVDSTNDRKIKANDSYYMLVHTPCPTVIVECGFITNYEEAALLITETYQEKIADAIVIGVMEYLSDK